jgi:hypothetical protein
MRAWLLVDSAKRGPQPGFPTAWLRSKCSATDYEGTMRYAFNTWAYSSFPAWLPAYPLDEAIRRLAAIGYDGVEIGCAAPHAWPAYLNTGRRAELRRLLNSCHLQAVSLLVTPGGGPGFNPTSPLVEEREATVDQHKQVIDSCIRPRCHKGPVYRRLADLWHKSYPGMGSNQGLFGSYRFVRRRKKHHDSGGVDRSCHQPHRNSRRRVRIDAKRGAGQRQGDV